MNDDVMRMQWLPCDTRVILLQLLPDLVIVMMQCLLKIDPHLLLIRACGRRTLRWRRQCKGDWKTVYLSWRGDDKYRFLIIRTRIRDIGKTYLIRQRRMRDQKTFGPRVGAHSAMCIRFEDIEIRVAVCAVLKPDMYRFRIGGREGMPCPDSECRLRTSFFEL